MPGNFSRLQEAGSRMSLSLLAGPVGGSQRNFETMLGPPINFRRLRLGRPCLFSCHFPEPADNNADNNVTKVNHRAHDRPIDFQRSPGISRAADSRRRAARGEPLRLWQDGDVDGRREREGESGLSRIKWKQTNWSQRSVGWLDHELARRRRKFNLHLHISASPSRLPRPAC